MGIIGTQPGSRGRSDRLAAPLGQAGQRARRGLHFRLERSPKLWLAFSAVTLALGFVWGAAVIKYRVFPYHVIHRYAPADPLNIARADYFATHTAHADTVIVGDSIPRGIEWSEYFPGVVNRAINSDSSADVLKRIGPLKAMHARRYIVMLGPNDIAMRVPPERFGANMRRIVRELPGSVVVQIASCGGCDPSPYNAELHKLGVPVAPLTLEPSDLVDRVHPKASGMDKIVAAVRPFIK